MMPKITIGIVIIKSLLMVVVRESSAKKSQTGTVALGDSKKLKRAQLIQEALPNIVTYELRSSLLYLIKLFLVTVAVSLIRFNSALLFPDAKKRATEMTQSRNQTERWALMIKAPA